MTRNSVEKYGWHGGRRWGVGPYGNRLGYIPYYGYDYNAYIRPEPNVIVVNKDPPTPAVATQPQVLPPPPQDLHKNIAIGIIIILLLIIFMLIIVR